MKENESAKLYHSITNINEQFIEEAQTKAKKKNGWLKWVAMASCLAIIVAIGAHALQQTAEPDIADEAEGETALVSSYLNIYYLSKNGTIQSKSIWVRCTPKDIFSEWAALNNISDVKFVDCVYDSNGTERNRGKSIEYTVGNYYTLTLTLSAEFSKYSESENGEHLIKSLRQTFYDYMNGQIDEFNLTIEGD